MGLPPKAEPLLTAQQFMAWYDQQPDGRRYELLEGVVYEHQDGRAVEMQGERVVHGRLIGRIFSAFANQIAKNGLACEAFVDGMAVRVDDRVIQFTALPSLPDLDSCVLL